MASARAIRRRGGVSAGDVVRRLGLTIAVFAAIGGIAYGGMTLAGDPRLALGPVSVAGAHRVAPAEIIAAAAFPPGRNIWLLDTASAARSIAALPWIASATIERAWPNQVTIAVVEREPAARLELGGGFSTLVDSDGRVLGAAGAPDEALPALTVEPLPDGAGSAGAQLGATAVGGALDALRQLRALGVHMTEIDIDPVMGFRVVADGGPAVVFGDLDDLARKVALYDAIRKRIARPESVEYIDLRSISAPTVQYR